MHTKLLIDAIVRQTTVLLAELSTAAGIRAPLAHVADQVFLELSRELEPHVRPRRRSGWGALLGPALVGSWLSLGCGNTRAGTGNTNWNLECEQDEDCPVHSSASAGCAVQHVKKSWTARERMRASTRAVRCPLSAVR